MIKNITFSLILLISFSGFGQDVVESQIKEIRKRFYALDNSKLSMVAVEDYHFYLQDGNIKKVTYENGSTRYECYFDLDFIPNHAYFIYVTENRGNGPHENRYYFSEEGELIRWVNHGKNEVILNGQTCVIKSKLIAQSKDLLTIYNNHLLNNENPQYRRLVFEIRTEVNDMLTKVLVPDTTEILNVPDEFYFSHTVEFNDKNGKRIKSLSFIGGDHGYQKDTAFFNKIGQILYKVSKNKDIFGRSSSRYEYYKQGELFRTVEQISVNHEKWSSSICIGFNHIYADEIYDY
ncbi:hypothetical protein [Flagellimonas sp. S3867]|uniref:hypothetical protein n=1 Tax=Flagellimonas sp. S3867 TaxID=2768063 RepID=UPI001685BA50|nr:hypothetical protein [Flagellimonas sp. S3867]